MTLMRPRILIDIERVKYPYCGLGQYSHHLAAAMKGYAEDRFTPIFLLPCTFEAFRNSHQFENRIYAWPWRREAVFEYIRSVMPSWIDSSVSLWHMTHQHSRYLPRDSRVPVVLTIHDLNFLREKSEPVIERNIARLQRLINRASYVTTISKFVANELQHYLDLGSTPLRVIHNGLTIDEQLTPVKPDYIGTRPFLFSIGTICPKKNFHTLVHFLQSFPHYDLVIAGVHEETYAAEIRHLAVAANVDDRLLMPGGIADEQRVWLYKHCEAFVFPSITEGFGLPVIEAMAFGRPVFLARRTSLPEIGGALAFYWDTFDSNHMVDRFREGMQIYSDDPYYSDKLRDWSREFSWEKAATQYVDVYQKVLDRNVCNSFQRRAA